MQILEILLLPMIFDSNYILTILGILITLNIALFKTQPNIKSLHEDVYKLKDESREVKKWLIIGNLNQKQEALLTVVDNVLTKVVKKSESKIEEYESKSKHISRLFLVSISIGVLDLIISIVHKVHPFLFLFIIIFIICILIVISTIKNMKDIMDIREIPKTIERLIREVRDKIIQTEEIIEKVDKKDYLGIINPNELE